MRTIATLILSTLASVAIVTLTPTIASAYPQYEPEDFGPIEILWSEDAEPVGCGFDIFIIWNDDFMTPAPMCAQKMVLEFNSIITDCANGGEVHCLLLAEHIVATYMPCFEKAAKLAAQDE